MPPLIDKFFGQTAGMIAYAVCFLVGVVFLLAAHADGIAHRRSRKMTVTLFALYGAVLGSLAGGLAGEIAYRVRRTTPIPQVTSEVQISVACDSISLPLPYSGDVWFLDVIWFHGLAKISAPPRNPSAMWPEEGVTGFGYKCVVKNHGAEPAFGVSIPVVVTALEVVRQGSSWQTGDPKESHPVQVSIPQPLSQHGNDAFTFYICSFNPDSGFLVQIPSIAWIDSDDPQKKRQVAVRFSSSFGKNPLEVPPKTFHPERKSN